MTKKRARIIPNERGKEGYRLEKWVSNTGNFIPLDEQELYGLLEDIKDILYGDEEENDGESDQAQPL